MSTKFTDQQTPTGTPFQAGDLTVYAIPKLGCYGCALELSDYCPKTPNCSEIIWVTYPQFVAHRLTS